MHSSNFIDYYQAIGVDRFASTEEIKARCLELGERLRPDKNSIGAPQNGPSYVLVEQAYAILCDPQSREAYDQTYNDHFIQQLSANHPSKFVDFKLGWWKQPQVIVTLMLIIGVSAFGVYQYLEYLEASEAETFYLKLRAEDSAYEKQRKEEERQEQLKEARREAQESEARWRHSELIEEQRKMRDDLEKLRADTDNQESRRRFREPSFR